MSTERGHQLAASGKPTDSRLPTQSAPAGPVALYFPFSRCLDETALKQPAWPIDSSRSHPKLPTIESISRQAKKRACQRSADPHGLGLHLFEAGGQSWFQRPS
jgi:hypothetical protein